MDRHFTTHTVDFAGSKPSWRVSYSTDEILRRDVVKFSATAACIEIALVGHFIIHHWHSPIITHLV